MQRMPEPSETGAKPDAAADRAPRWREFALIGGTALAFLGFVVAQLWAPGVADSSSLTGNVTFFLLTNLNVILLVLLAFLVGRSIIRLAVDRRRGIFGSRLRTRLVLLFVGMSLAPSIILFTVARGFLNHAIDTWFDVRIRSSLQGSIEVADTYYQSTADHALHFAREVAERIHAEDLGEARSGFLQRRVADKRREWGVAAIAVFDAGGSQRARATDASLRQPLPEIAAALVQRVLAGERVADTQALGRADVVRVGVPIGVDPDPVGVVVVDWFVPRNVATQARTMSQAYEEYRQLAGMEQPLENQYVLTLALITLVVIFSASWVGLRQAKSITGPLLRLEEGTREVAQGNWEYRIDAGNDEETAVLVESFNRMTADLQAINSELEERHKFVESILANITAGVVSLDGAGCVTTLNRAAESMLGLRASAVRSRPWREAFARVDLAPLGKLIEESMRRPEKLSSRQVRLTGGEQAITALASATTLTDDAGAATGLLLFVENVTDLLRIQRMEAWREVARRLAHEIKNPLTPIQLSAQRVHKRYRDQLPEGDRAVLDECTTTIVSQVEALKHLVQEFSAFARLPSAQLVPADINPVVEEALSLFRAAHPHVQLRFDAGEDLPQVPLDREAVKRVLINMLDNAVAACEAAPDRPSVIDVSTTYGIAREVVHLVIADNGIGMSPEAKLRVFEPYFSTKKDGTGLGMAIVAAIVSDHQAYIRVSDNEPHGTCFTINFPIRRAQDTDRLGVTT